MNEHDRSAFDQGAQFASQSGETTRLDFVNDAFADGIGNKPVYRHLGITTIGNICRFQGSV
jgi:hypothetical protein